MTRCRQTGGWGKAGERPRGTALVVGLLLTVTVSLLALSLLLGTAERQPGLTDTQGVQTLLQADSAARSAQIDLAAPESGKGRSSFGLSDELFETRRASPVLVGLWRGGSDLRLGVDVGWGEVWELRVAARRTGARRGRALGLRFERPGVPRHRPLRVAVVAGRVLGFSDPDRAAAAAWQSAGAAATVAPAAAEPLYLRAGLAGYDAFRDGLRSSPLVLVRSGGELRALDGATGRLLFAWAGSGEGDDAVAPFVGDAVVGATPCPSSGSLPEGCTWRTVALAGVGHAVLAIDVTSGPLGPASLLWRRDLDVPVSGAALGRVPALASPGEGVFAALVAAGSRLFVLDLATGRTIETKTVRGATRELSPPAALDLDGDALLDMVYTVDDGGRLWRVDLTSGRDPILRAESGVNGAANLPPAVIKAGTDPETGDERLVVAWASSSPGRGVSAVLETPLRSVEGVSSPSGLALDSPRLTACGELGPSRAGGWSLGLRRQESVSSSLAVLDHTLYFTTNEPYDEEAPGNSHGRLYRLDALNGDPCRGASCCGRSVAASIRGAALGRTEPEKGPLGTIQVVPDAHGRPALVVARAGGRPLVVPATAVPAVVAWKEAPATRWVVGPDPFSGGPARAGKIGQ